MDEHPFGEFASKGFDLALFELDGAIDEGKKSVIGATLDILAGVKLGAALTDEDIAFIGLLTTVNFDAEALGDGIAPKGC